MFFQSLWWNLGIFSGHSVSPWLVPALRFLNHHGGTEITESKQDQAHQLQTRTRNVQVELISTPMRSRISGGGAGGSSVT